MNTEELAHTRAYFNRQAPDWDRRMAPKNGEHEKIQEAIAALNIGIHDQVLDAGCGTGVLIPYLKPHLQPPGCIYALDISRAMLQEARKKHGTSLVHYIDKDVESFAASASSRWLDKIVCFSAFPHFPEQENALRGFYSLLKEGGHLLIFHLQGSRQINKIHASLSDTRIRSHTLPPVSRLREAAQAAGFAVEKSRDSKEGYCLLAEKR